MYFVLKAKKFVFPQFIGALQFSSVFKSQSRVTSLLSSRLLVLVVGVPVYCLLSFFLLTPIRVLFSYTFSLRVIAYHPTLSIKRLYSCAAATFILISASSKKTSPSNNSHRALRLTIQSYQRTPIVALRSSFWFLFVGCALHRLVSYELISI